MVWMLMFFSPSAAHWGEQHDTTRSTLHFQYVLSSAARTETGQVLSWRLQASNNCRRTKGTKHVALATLPWNNCAGLLWENPACTLANRGHAELIENCKHLFVFCHLKTRSKKTGFGKTAMIHHITALSVQKHWLKQRWCPWSDAQLHFSSAG